MHTTSASLLARLSPVRGTHDFDNAAWEHFVSLYTPLLLSFARRVCSQDQDAVDLLQDVFTTLLRKLPQFTYDAQKSFRGWLRTITLNKWRERQRLRLLPIAEDSTEQIHVHELVSHADAEAFWETEYRRHLVDRALLIMKADFAPQTWKACFEVVVNGRSAPQVAKEFGMTIGAVYAAKVRVLARLRDELKDLVD